MTLPMAISPDGNELAYPSDNQFYPDNYAARHPGTITVQDVATGARRTWSVWPAADTAITSVSWAANGELGVVGTLGDAAVACGAVVHQRGTDLHVAMVLNTRGSGSSLVGQSRIVAYNSFAVTYGGLYVPVTTGPTGVISPDGASFYVLLGAPAHGAGRLVRIDVAAGKVVQTLVTRPAQPVLADPVAIDGRYLLLSLGPVRPPKPRGSYVCGHLAAVRLPPGQARPLAVPITCSTAAPPPPQRRWAITVAC